ncbi:MAG: spore coat U domain-containing protein [Proteobacteria bacterium]|nr:spore coat U domain-containing protein [Pseudomonadota bacterium]
MIKLAAYLGTFFCASLFWTSLYAATSTTSLAVSATVVSDCAVIANPLGFGNYGLTSPSNLDSTSTINVTCTLSVPFNIGLDAGAGAGATVTNRKLTKVSASQTLNYALYQDSGRTTNWGNTPGTDTVASTGTGLLQAFTVYGRIPMNQTSPSGVYNDTVTVTVTY